MGIGAGPLPSLGQVRNGDSRQVLQFRPRTPKSRTPAVEASERSLMTEERLDEWRSVLRFHISKNMSTSTAYFLETHIRPLNTTRIKSLGDGQLRLQELDRSVQRIFVVDGLQKAAILNDEAQRTIRLSYRGRITGPIKFVNKLLATWQLGAEKACILLGIEPSQLSYVKAVLQGNETLTGRDAKDRIAHLFQIRQFLSTLFQDEAVENEWLREPQDLLKGKVPMDLLLEGSMENLLLVREYVERVSGR